MEGVPGSSGLRRINTSISTERNRTISPAADRQLSWRNQRQIEGNWRTTGRSINCLGEHSEAIQNANWRGTASNTWESLSTSRAENEDPNREPKEEYIRFNISRLLRSQPAALLTFLVKNLTDFNNYLYPPHPPHVVTLQVFVIKKICLSKSNVKFSNTILSGIRKNFMKQLDLYLVHLSFDIEDLEGDNRIFWKNPEDFWESLLVILEYIVDKLQKDATQYLLLKIIKTSLIAIEFHENSQGVSVKEVITQKLEYLQIQNGTQSEDDYRSVNLYSNEIFDQKETLTNNTGGSFNNVEHYLSTHFQWLLKNYAAPLREAIYAYKNNLKNNKPANVTEFYVYADVNFFKKYKTSFHESFVLLNTGKCIEKFVYEEWMFTKGNILCFSSDCFESMFFGIVKAVDEGCYNVQLFENVPFLYDQKYTMLEYANSYIYHYWILKALQNSNIQNFPMEKYILNPENKPEHPSYLTPRTTFILNNFEFTVLDFETWLSKEELNLDKFQYQAFKNALTSKCALIQGPSGTGKTHIGLKIAQTLIQNSNTPKPILVLADTNHTLDLFLEGLVPYTKEICRLGRNCTNEKVVEFSSCPIPPYITIRNNFEKRIKAAITVKNEMMQQLECVLSYDGIFDLRTVGVVIPELQSSLLYHWNGREITSWLLGNFSTEQEREVRWEMINNLFDDYQVHTENFQFRPTTGNNYILTISGLERIVQELEDKLEFKNMINMETIFENWQDIEKYYKQTRDNIKYIQWRLQRAKQHSDLFESKPVPMDDVLGLSHNDRWILYFHWLNRYILYLKEALKRNNATVYQIWEDLEDYKQRRAGHYLPFSTVVGMTTSGAIKNRQLLESLHCRIVIVEEANRVLESHMVMSLTNNCEHLILIGDDQQVKSLTTDCQIEKDPINISLFERLVHKSIYHSTLRMQHRMRPEISRLIVPAVYPNLQNHSSVYNLPKVAGIQHSIFFITHEHPEEEIENYTSTNFEAKYLLANPGVEVGDPKKNTHEVKYLIALARHLVLQGNDPTEITILTMYKGQKYEIEKEISNGWDLLQNMRVRFLADFQENESEIVLLSLVCSNNQSDNGFLLIERRICDAISRAKRGFYMIGNTYVLNQSGKIWSKIKEVFVKNKQVGPGLQLTCQLHPLNVTMAANPEDFLKVPDGGCYMLCSADLICGHVCQRKCHVTDLDHTAYNCLEPCTKILCADNHKCLKKCSEECDPCVVLVERLLPCEHQQLVPCSMKLEEFQCPVLTSTKFRCGHTVEKPCFQTEDKFLCVVEVKAVKSVCGHVVEKKCHIPVSDVSCEAIVHVSLKCGHSLQGYCWQKSDYSEEHCREQCSKTLKCGHVCPKRCHFYSADKCKCEEKCTKLKSGCKTDHKCDLACSEPCQPCHEDVTIELGCEHLNMVPCCKSNGTYLCESSCKKIKPCGHICYSKCHKVCDSNCFFKVQKSFSGCGHRVKVNCSEDLAERICLKCSKKNATVVERAE